MTEAQKQKIIDEVLSDFDFKRVYAIRTLCRKFRSNYDRTVEELRASAEKLLRMVLDHIDRGVWWAASGEFFVFYDRNWGITLQYIPFMSRVNFPEIREIEAE